MKNIYYQLKAKLSVISKKVSKYQLSVKILGEYQLSVNPSRPSYSNKRPLQQPALGALTFLRSFVAGRANFCSHLLASLVHFIVVKSQAILSIPASWGHRSYFRRNFISSASFKATKMSTSLDMYRHNNFACGICISIVALTATM